MDQDPARAGHSIRLRASARAAGALAAHGHHHPALRLHRLLPREPGQRLPLGLPHRHRHRPSSRASGPGRRAGAGLPLLRRPALWQPRDHPDAGRPGHALWPHGQDERGLGPARQRRRPDRLGRLDRQLHRSAPPLRGPLRGRALRPHALAGRQSRQPGTAAGRMAGVAPRRYNRPSLTMTRPRPTRYNAIALWLPGLALAAVALVGVVGVALIDAARSEKYHSLLELLTPDATAASWTMALVGTSEGVAIAIVIVVVVLGVQLTADRYSPRIIDIFVRDPMNGVVLALFLGSIVFTIYVSAEIKADYVPLASVGTAVVLAVIDFAILMPY